MFSFKPDLERSLERIEAFWRHAVLDRPVVNCVLYKPQTEWLPYPASCHATPAERWMDAAYQAEYALADLSNRLFLGDSLPVAYPNLGPDVFASFYGCALEFGDFGTSWSVPILSDWSRADEIEFDRRSPYLERLLEMTDALLEIGQGRFITGMSDWHPGGDCLAALRDPQNLATDLLDHPQEVKALLVRLEADYQRLYDLFYQKLCDAGQPISAWIPLTCAGKFYIPSNDFSGMISPAMYQEFFLPELRRECQALDRSIYHLDGPSALRHLEAVLGIPELDAVQFVPTATDETFAKWAHVYRRIQVGGKSLQVTCRIGEIEQVMQALRPQGVYLEVREVPSAEAAETMLKKLEEWR